jgi:hypothetical protein
MLTRQLEQKAERAPLVGVSPTTPIAPALISFSLLFVRKKKTLVFT